MTTAHDTGRPNTRRWALWALAAAAAVVILVPAGVWASDAFTDVPQGNVHHDSIGAIADAGVTQGCTPTEYCPSDFTRRDQMASFMDRLGALSGQTPVVNAATAVTAETAGSVEGMDDVLGRLDALEAENVALQGRVDDLEAGGTGGGELAARVEDLEAENAALRGDVDELTGLLAGVSRQDQEVGGNEVYDTLVFSGMNVQVVNGEGLTDSTNGLGNLIVGYNQPRAETPFVQEASQRTGSHSLVVGDRHGWTSFGHILGGFSNDASGEWATAIGGRLHDASGLHASVFGGTSGTATANHAAVFGGAGNTASDTNAAAFGGQDNTASGNGAATSGGQNNTASNSWASVSGGQGNSATANWASILGGLDQTLNIPHGIYPPG